MSRRFSEATHRTSFPPRGPGASPVSRRPARWELWLLRVCFVTGASLLAAAFHPWGLSAPAAAAVGAIAGLVLVAAELRLAGANPGGLLGATVGILAGTLVALFASAVLSLTALSQSGKAFVALGFLLCFGYLGVALGTRLGLEIPPDALRSFFRRTAVSMETPSPAKLLDTSVLIDGRIADICEAHFLDGPLLVPQFVLHELQVIADSGDTLRRQRGRRGLEVLQRIQKMAHLGVRVLADDSAGGSEVDHKLVELALHIKAKIVTNDFNLNKVASVQGIGVLNVNELANALRPAVLPGESMRVFVLREGKEANQGVAYLEDGTMVVVDGARRLINKTVDIVVTSVHQTPAGKMIFGRVEGGADAGRPAPRQAPTPARTLNSGSGERNSEPDIPKSEIQ